MEITERSLPFCSGMMFIICRVKRNKDPVFKDKLQIGAAAGCLMLVVVLVLGRSRPRVVQQAAAVEVQAAQVEQQDVPIQSEWIGTLDGMVNAEIRAQVSGYSPVSEAARGAFG